MLNHLCLSLAALLGLTLPATTQTPGDTLPGQVVRDPQNPQWLMRAGGERLFLVGPGDPEDFLYRGERQADGTRVGDQLEIIQKMAESGGNTLYVQAVRSHGGDGFADHNPFHNNNPSHGLNPAVLEQWDEWITAADEAGIVVFFFFYDDSAAIWDGFGDVVPAEAAFMRDLTNSIEKHPNLILIVAEESEEARSAQHARELAEIIVEADDYDHLVGDHHHSGTTFKSWSEGSSMQVFGMQRNVTGDAVHNDAVSVYTKARQSGTQGNAWMAVYTEAAVTLDAGNAARRHFIWGAAMGGLQPLIYGMDVNTTPITQLAQCRTLQDFMEQSDVWTMEPADHRAAGGTRWALANDQGSAILYTRQPGVNLGITDMQDETVDLHWLDTITGQSFVQEAVQVTAGTNLFARPEHLGNEVALWITRSWSDLGHSLAGKFGAPTLKVLGKPEALEPITIEITNAHPMSIAKLILSETAVFTPTHGGVLVPAVDGQADFGTGPTGTFSITGIWPPGIPSLSTFYAQVWIFDPGGPNGYAVTNAVVEVTP
ncbi:MAG: hypothetical protein DHS20C15_15730 [Planctomycetota bacterium]|nr:MAG: hypothetical protein DHS20C15_15730 [Planctomycetota bacterium]